MHLLTVAIPQGSHPRDRHSLPSPPLGWVHRAAAWRPHDGRREEAAPAPAGPMNGPGGLAAAFSPKDPQVLNAGSRETMRPSCRLPPHPSHHKRGVLWLRPNSPGPGSSQGSPCQAASLPLPPPSQGFPRCRTRKLRAASMGRAAWPASLGPYGALATTPLWGRAL